MQKIVSLCKCKRMAVLRFPTYIHICKYCVSITRQSVESTQYLSVLCEPKWIMLCVTTHETTWDCNQILLFPFRFDRFWWINIQTNKKYSVVKKQLKEYANVGWWVSNWDNAIRRVGNCLYKKFLLLHMFIHIYYYSYKCKRENICFTYLFQYKHTSIHTKFN